MYYIIKVAHNNFYSHDDVAQTSQSHKRLDTPVLFAIKYRPHIVKNSSIYTAPKDEDRQQQKIRSLQNTYINRSAQNLKCSNRMMNIT